MSGLAGTLKQRVALSRPDPARDAIGGLSGAWIEEGASWAEVVPRRDGWRIAWGAVRLRVSQVTRDPRSPERVTLVAEAIP